MPPFENQIPADEQPGGTGEARPAKAGSESVYQAQAAANAGSLFALANTSPRRRPPTRLLTLVAAVLILALLTGSLALLLSRRQQGVAQTGDTAVITPDGGSPSTPTPGVYSGGLFEQLPPLPAYYLNGYIYQDTTVYNASTGTPTTQYWPHLGNLLAVSPQLVNGIVYMVGSVRSKHVNGKLSLFALRPADGSVIWQWNNCGESLNMEGLVFIGSSVYLACQAAAGASPSWHLVSLRARTGALLWSEQLPGEPSEYLAGDQQGVYLPVDNNQLLAWSPTTGQQLWERSFGDSIDHINSVDLGQGVVYVTSEENTFTALATTSGKTLWSYQFRGDFTGISVVVAPQTVYLIAYEQSRPATVYAVNSGTGLQRWHHQLTGSPDFVTTDEGNLYLLYSVYSDPQATVPAARSLAAVSGSDGHTLWQTAIPWNSRHVPREEAPVLTVGGGRLYLVDWRDAASTNELQETAVMGAVSEGTGVLLWSTPVD